MAKLKDLLLAINKELGLNSKEIEAVAGAGALADIDVTDEESERITGQLKGMIALDKAQEHPEIVQAIKTKLYPQHQKTILEKFEATQDDFVKNNFGEDKLIELHKVDNAYDRQAKISEWTKESLNAKKKPGDEGGDAELVKKYADLARAYEDDKKGWQTKEQELKQGFEQEKLKDVFMRKATSKTWQDHYADEKLKNLIIGDTFNEIANMGILKLNQAGEFQIFDKNNPDLELHQGSKKVAVNDLMEQKFLPYLKRNDAGGQGKPNQPNPQENKKTFEDYKNKPVDMRTERQLLAQENGQR